MIIYLPLGGGGARRRPSRGDPATGEEVVTARSIDTDRLPEYRVKARNTSESSENKIHDNQVAREFGFRGGLVPGVTVYAYLTHPLVEAFGAAWLQRGTATARFLKPIFDGEEVRVSGGVTSRDAKGIAATVWAVTESTGECATLTATLPAGSPVPLNLALYPAAPLPAERPVASREHFASLDALGTPVNPYDEERCVEYTTRVSDTLALYRGDRGWVHPGFLLDQSNKALSLNARMSPWIHAGSVVRHLGGARVGETLATRGRVRSLFEKKGKQFIEADLAIVAGDRPRPVAHVLHTAIYCLTSSAR